ncbi:hypothetical protein SporoP17a_13815 [Sporosarcina ureae]|nr:hypothetical protein SporoP17a_13815 [Sporosarcina ureae]
MAGFLFSEIVRTDGGSTVDLRSRRTLSHGPAVSQLGRELPLVVSPDRADPSGVAAFHADQLHGGS